MRPLRRRAARMARPARVFMRSRKPWVFARRRVFGWKVRLLITILQLKILGISLVSKTTCCCRRFQARQPVKSRAKVNLGSSYYLLFRKYFLINLKEFLRDTPFRFAFNQTCWQEFNSLSFTQAISVWKTYPQSVHKNIKLWKTIRHFSKSKGIRRVTWPQPKP